MFFWKSRKPDISWKGLALAKDCVSYIYSLQISSEESQSVTTLSGCTEWIRILQWFYNNSLLQSRG